MLFFTHCFGFVLDLVHFRSQYYKARAAFSAAVQLVCVVRPTTSPTRQAPAAGWLSASGEDTAGGCPLSWPCPGRPRCSECRGLLKAALPDLGSVATLRGDSIVFRASGIQGPGPGGWAALQCCLGQHFVVLLERNEQVGGRHRFLLLVLLLGTARQAERFSYRLVLSRQRRRLTWEANPRGLTGTVSPSTADSLVFDTVVAQLFADNGSLAINVTISSCP
ncbi:seven in absentia homolog 3-like isoform X1 [Chiloscyllium punctatum]|uniref:seven in absentia homolog 3-like isoform X1 n=1 Tax=Chiloscyllium punctatum TaxID=137246 RepID=UPI003B633BCA